jgi:hypothetical protein
MSKLTGWKAGVIAVAFVAWPFVATAQTSQGSGQQSPPQGTNPPQAQPANPPQPSSPQEAQPANPQQPGQAGTQGGFGQGQGQGDNVRQIALGHLTAARQDLADITKLPAAAQIQGQARTELNDLITSFNALITSTGPEWRQAYDRVQSTLTALLGPQQGQPGQTGEAGQSAVGTSGATAAASLDPGITAKLNDMRQHVDEFGQTVGLKPGQSAVAQQNAQSATAGTSGAAVPNEQALRSIDQIGEILSRVLSQASPDQATITVNRQDLQQIQEYLNQLRQSLQGSIR